MFLKTIKEESGDSKDKYEDEDEDITFIARKIRKLLQFRKNDKRKVLGNLNPLGRVRVRNPHQMP